MSKIFDTRCETCDMRCSIRDTRYAMCDTRYAMCDTRYAKKSQIANRKSSIEHRASSIENRKSHIAWHLCLVLILLMYGLLFLFRSYIPEPWTALIAVGLLVVYRILRYWLHPMVKRTRLINSSNS